MIVCPRKTSLEGNSDFLDSNWYDDEEHKDWVVVDETTEDGKAFASRIRESFPYIDLVIEDGKLIDIVEWPEISYSVDKTQILLGETVTITTELDTIAVIDRQEYLLTDGILEYSNENIGMHTIELRKDNKKHILINIEVIENAH